VLVVLAEILALAKQEMGAGNHLFSPALLMPSPALAYTFVTLRP
jgi:hypothetical protein